jgi:beta-glucosidase
MTLIDETIAGRMRACRIRNLPPVSASNEHGVVPDRGGVDVGGRGAAVWDTFCAEPGRIRDGSSGAVACDHVHRYAEDVALMRRLGTQGYRFSIAWPRIQPDGTGPANQEGLGFYDRLVDELLAAGVEPMATLFHWDLPQALEDTGGWTSRATAERFGDYAALVVGRLGDRVAQWIPVNEPNVVTMIGYGLGLHAPGRTLMFDALPVAHHLLLGHGLAVQALRAAGRPGGRHRHQPHAGVAGDDDADDRAAGGPVRRAVEPALRRPGAARALPRGLRRPDARAGRGGPAADRGAARLLRLQLLQPDVDPGTARGRRERRPDRRRRGAAGTRVRVRPDARATHHRLRLADRPRRALRADRLLDERYPDAPPLYVTESGCSFGMGPDADGVVDDQPRIDYLDSHLRAVEAAVRDGSDVRGYYAWSLMDNFEWAEGYTQRFGLVWIDYETQERIPKRSFDWYAAVIAANRR